MQTRYRFRRTNVLLSLIVLSPAILVACGGASTGVGSAPEDGGADAPGTATGEDSGNPGTNEDGGQPNDDGGGDATVSDGGSNDDGGDGW